MNLKFCSKCGMFKPSDLTHFRRASAKKGGLYSYCRDCHNKTNRAYFAANRGAQVGRKLMERYGITLDEYERMLEEQGGHCAICEKTEGARGRRLHVDHCHTTGRVRGLLCSTCNRGIGMLRDDVELMRRALAYMEGSRA